MVRGDATRPAVVPSKPSEDDSAGWTMMERGDATRPAVVPSKPSEDDSAGWTMIGAR